MSIKTKNAGAYADIVGVFHKRAGAYEAVQGIYAKAGGVYGRVDFSVTPSLAVSRVDGVGPLGVVFDATATTASSGDAFHDLLYFFDFGDGTSANYTYGTLAGTTKNRFVGGPVSCHVYETPGSYTATLWVYDGSRLWGPVTQAITVSDPDVVYAGTLTTVVSTDGDFTGAPSGAVQVTSSDFDAQGSVMTSNRRVLFKRGQTFDASANTVLGSARAGLTVGVFGSGSDYAVINAITNGITLLGGIANGSNPANNMDNWRVFGLHFTRADGVTGGVGFSTGLVGASSDPATFTKGNTTIHNCKFSKINLGANINGTANVISQCVSENINQGVAASGGGSVFGDDVYRFGLIDCAFDNSQGGEHVLRLNAGIQQCVIGSQFRRCANNGKQLLTVRGDTASLYLAGKVVVADCVLDASDSAGAVNNPIQLGAQGPVINLLFVGNYVSASPESTIVVGFPATGSAVMNNVIRAEGTTAAAVTGISCNLQTTPEGQPTTSKVTGNTFYYADALGFTAVTISATRTETEISANIAYAPNAIRSSTTGADGPKFLSDLGTDTTASNNSTDSQVKNTDPLFNGALTSMAGFKLQTGSPYKNAGGDFKNWIDGLGFLRQVGGQFDAGAMNSVDKQTDAWTLID